MTKPSPAKNEVFQQLQKELIAMQGYRATLNSQPLNTGLGPIEQAFPGKSFPIGAVHEFISDLPEHAAATNGFIIALLGQLMRQSGMCIWVSTKRTLFPPALKTYGIEPDRIIFIDLHQEKEALWTIEEALKCTGLAAVVGELPGITLTQSRRLQLAVETSMVTGFLHRFQPKMENTIASISRWKISSLPSIPEVGMPGIGFPRWQVQLLKIRNGQPGNWQLEWAAGKFQPIPGQKKSIIIPAIRKAV